MGLSSALNTALTGLTAAETTIDVVGNNIANSNTVGFKSSEAVFANQLLQTRSLGSGPTDTSGGTNPRQVGLGVQVAEITPDFTQGTIEISSTPSDLAIQGDGFFIVEANGAREYTRNGILKTNSANELVTSTGRRLLGHGVDEDFNIVPTELVPLTIPLGAAAVAQATQNVVLEGTLIPNGDLATTAQVLQTAILGDGSTLAPATTDNPDIAVAEQAPDTFTATEGIANATALAQGYYRYKVVYVDAFGNESTPSDDVVVQVTNAGGREVDLGAIPDDTDYANRRIYRTAVQASAALSDPPPTYYRIGTLPVGGAVVYNDNLNDAGLVAQPQLDTDVLDGNYSYRITYFKTGQPESRPSGPTVPVVVSNGRLRLTGFPPDPSGGDFDGIKLYRNLANDNSRFLEVKELNFGEEFIDNYSDDELLTLNHEVDLDGPRVTAATLLTDVLVRDGDTYSHAFEVGTLDFSGKKGGRTLESKTLDVTATTSVLDLMNFMEQSLGIQIPPGPDSINPIPGDSSSFNVGGDVVGGRITLTSNNGRDNAVDVSLSSFSLTTATNQRQVNLGFGVVQQAVGETTAADFVVYDSLGIPLNVRVTVALESRNSTSTTYRWFADSPDNDPASGVGIAVGTGLISFDGEGNVTNVTENTVSIERRNVSSVSPMEFDLDFSSLSGLAAQKSSLAAARQDGSAPGTLSSYIIGEDGLIRGVFSNGASRDLGQIRLVRFANPAGLEQRGENLYAEGVNSGLPVEGDPGTQGIGTLVAGAVELSNTDIGANLIDLILASTQYRGNTRIITAAQQLLDELLNLRR
ncbi:MAG: flagellar hook-basal body complex protein [Pirellulales bacterium]|nr:flagellar hook-basal body complex protein [Pirellulales bacterium]